MKRVESRREEGRRESRRKGSVLKCQKSLPEEGKSPDVKKVGVQTLKR